jgi:hypothetical protein
MPENKRIHLLSKPEIEDLYSLPQFNQDERRYYFSLSKSELNDLDLYKNVKTRLYFILQLGYFKATQQFYNFNFEDVKADIRFIFKTYLQTNPLNLKGKISRNYNQKQKENILKLVGYSAWSETHSLQVESHLCELVKTYPKTHNAFRELLVYFEAKKIVIPSYRTLQDIFTKVLRIEQKRISSLILSFPKHLQKQLEDLIHHEDGLTQLNIMRSDQKDFQYTALKLEIEKTKKLSELYLFCKSCIPKLGLSKNAIRYYADLTDQYAPARLRRLSKAQKFLHLICFVYHRYQQFMDNLIITFMYHVRALLEAGKSYADMAFLQHGSKLVVEFPKLAQFLEWFPSQEVNPGITYSEFSREAYKILPKQQFEPLAKFIAGHSFDKKAAKWQFYGQSSRIFALYLRPILLTVDFEFHTKDSAIMPLILMLKNHYNSGKFPSALKLSDDLDVTLPKNIIPYLKLNSVDQYVDPHLLEFFVYQKMYHHFDRGRMFCNDSVSYGDLNHDLVDDELVDDVEKIAIKFGYSKIPIYCDAHLDRMLEKLDMAWDITLQNINSGQNHGIKFKQKKDKLEWSLSYDSTSKQQDSFFKNLPQVEISNLVKCVGDLVGIWKSFSHSKDRYTKRKASSPVILNACILAEAFGMGAQKICEMSDLNYALLRSVSKDFINVENLRNANELVGNYIYSLPIFKLWNLLDNKLLADADGQKFSTRSNTIQSRYSKKYLGKGKGISLYTLLANFVAVNAKNIGLNEYEGHSLYDMVYGNKTDIPIDMVTGDNHSLNQLNFVALDSIDVDYVPSIKNIRKVAEELYSVKPSDNYTGFLKPKGQINISRIKSQKRGILRVLLSLLIQENTQSTIIRKLNSHSRYVRLRAALFEYNNIFKSIHVLNLINDMNMRKAIRTARNRTEAYHQFQSLIRKVYHGVFRGKKIVDNRISAQASRLVANCSVAYNATILNALYEKMLQSGVPQEMIERFARISPIAWTHIFFTGKYNFRKSDGQIDFEKIISILEKQVKKYFGILI